MIVTSSLDSIELVLGSNVTTNQLHINAHYNVISTGSVTPVKNSLTSSNTTAVTIVPAPASDTQHQLRYCNIFNSDISKESVEVRYNYNGINRTVLSASLQINEYIQYTPKTGWKVFNENGALKVTDGFTAPSDVRGSEFFLSSNTNGSMTIANQTTYGQYLGKATGNYNYITIAFINLAGLSAGAWGEFAIYRGKFSLATTASLTRLSYIDTTTLWSTNAQNQYKFYAMDVKGVQAGDDLWAVYAASGSSISLRGGSVSDDIGAGFHQIFGSSRPSENPNITATAIATGSTNLVPFVHWSGL